MLVPASVSTPVSAGCVPLRPLLAAVCFGLCWFHARDAVVSGGRSGIWVCAGDGTLVHGYCESDYRNLSAVGGGEAVGEFRLLVRLPNCDRAVVADPKVRDYLLSPSHAVGRFKSAFFLALGFSAAAARMSLASSIFGF